MVVTVKLVLLSPTVICLQTVTNSRVGKQQHGTEKPPFGSEHLGSK